MTVIDTTAVNTNNILPSTIIPTATTARTSSSDTEAQIINDTGDAPVSRKFGVSALVVPITTGTIKSEIMKEIYCSGSLLEAVQKAHIFHDCKHFVDMPLKTDAETTLQHWHELIASGQIDENSLRRFVENHFDEPGGELDNCEPSDFDPEYGKFESINSPSYRQWAKELHRKWPTLCRKVSDRVIANPAKFSLIPLPKPFVVPGGRFREMYYWDSFFTIKGLLASGMYDTVRGMIENMGSLIERFGYVPNGNRVYYLNRSQPPLLTWCLSAYYEATGDKKFVLTGARWFEREFQFFQKHKSIKLPGVTSLLYRYHVVAVGPRPESYREDVESAHHIEDVLEKQRLWGDIAAAAESGRDFSSRWFSQDGPVAGKMGSTRTSSILPIDLNAIICGNFRLMANLYEAISDMPSAEHCRQQFIDMKQAIHQIFWNEECGCWFDYDIIRGCHVNLYMDTNFFPLFTGCTHDDFDPKKIVSYMTNMGVLAFPGGLPSSLIASKFEIKWSLTMSAGLESFALKEEDAVKLLACQTHVGAANCDFQMEQYVWKRRADGVHIIHLRKTWEKLLLAARAIAAIDNPADVCVVSARPYAQRALLKFAAHTGSTPIFGRFTPGCLTNQIQKQFKESRFLIVSDPRVDHQAVTEASYVGVPVISFCNTDSPLKFIDIAIPCNNKGVQSIGLMWWLLAREVLLIKGKMTRQTGFVLDDKEIMPDLYFYRNPEEQEKEELSEPREVKEPWPGVPPPEVAKIDEVVRSMGMYQTVGGVEPAKKLDFSMVEPVSDWAQETERAVQLDTAQQQEWGASAQNSNW